MNGNVLPRVGPHRRDVFVYVVCAEPAFRLAAEVFVLARQQKDIDAVNVEKVSAVGEKFC